MPIRFFVEEQPWMGSLRLYARLDYENGSFIPGKLDEEHRLVFPPEGQVGPGVGVASYPPILELSYEAVRWGGGRELAEALCGALLGFSPEKLRDREIAAEAKLEAQGRHLEDMRVLVLGEAAKEYRIKGGVDGD